MCVCVSPDYIHYTHYSLACGRMWLHIYINEQKKKRKIGKFASDMRAIFVRCLSVYFLLKMMFPFVHMYTPFMLQNTHTLIVLSCANNENFESHTFLAHEKKIKYSQRHHDRPTMKNKRKSLTVCV